MAKRKCNHKYECYNTVTLAPNGLIFKTKSIKNIPAKKSYIQSTRRHKNKCTMSINLNMYKHFFTDLTHDS
jgi:hypothetical protein